MPSFRRNGKSVLQFITNETKESWERLSDSQVFMEFSNMDELKIITFTQMFQKTIFLFLYY